MRRVYLRGMSVSAGDVVHFKPVGRCGSVLFARAAYNTITLNFQLRAAVRERADRCSREAWRLREAGISSRGASAIDVAVANSGLYAAAGVERCRRVHASIAETKHKTAATANAAK